MNLKTKILPQIVKRFLAAANRRDATLAAACFTPAATVSDEDRDYQGREAIHQWMDAAGRRYQPTFIPLQSFVSDDVVRVQMAVSGQFPGSPVTLDFELRVQQGKISALTIV
jgi:SnoaL-like domain